VPDLGGLTGQVKPPPGMVVGGEDVIRRAFPMNAFFGRSIVRAAKNYLVRIARALRSGHGLSVEINSLVAVTDILGGPTKHRESHPSRQEYRAERRSLQ
jgi:hypothetical protein